MKRRARPHPGEGPPTAAPGRHRRARLQLTGVFGVVTVLAFASAGAFLARAAEPLTAPAPAPIAASRVPARVVPRVRSVLPGLAVMSSRPVQFHHRRVLAPEPAITTTTTTTTTVPVTTPPTTAPAVASIDGPSDSYSAPSGLCAAAVAQVSWPPGWPVSCEGPRSGLLGLTNREGTHLYMRSGLSESFYVMVAGHEAGHAWDFTRLSSSDIATWCAARGCDAAHFFEGSVTGPGWVEAGGAEDWAEAWRICHGGTDMRNYIGLGLPTPSLCALQLHLVAS